MEEDQRRWPAIALDRAPTEIPSPQAPLKVAEVLCKSCFTYEDGFLVLRHWRGSWWHWQGGWWQELKPREIRADLFQLLADCVYTDGDGHVTPWAPTLSKLNNLLHAMASVCHLRDAVEQPSWLIPGPQGEVVACRNGLLNVGDRDLYPHTPGFLNQTAVPFNYDANAPVPARWLEFLEELWPDEEDQQQALQEWFGYVISGRSDLQKILLLVGPTRAGKGVISNILTALLGRKNVANPTLSSLSGEFGLAPLIGKPLGLISDARLGTRDSSVPVERLLSISGEDALTINIKYQEQWTGKLPTRLMVVSNELPAFTDASGAIVGRFLTLILRKSWFGQGGPQPRLLAPAGAARHPQLGARRAGAARNRGLVHTHARERGDLQGDARSRLAGQGVRPRALRDWPGEEGRYGHALPRLGAVGERQRPRAQDGAGRRARSAGGGAGLADTCGSSGRRVASGLHGSRSGLEGSCCACCACCAPHRTVMRNTRNMRNRINRWVRATCATSGNRYLGQKAIRL